MAQNSQRTLSKDEKIKANQKKANELLVIKRVRAEQKKEKYE